MRDYHKRSFAKAISYRITASATTAILVYLFTGKLLLSIGIGSVDGVAKIILYYLHERLWNKYHWGKH
jgi:adenylylsulfate kinase